MLHLRYGGNMYVILVYDISLENKREGSRVLNNVYKICKKYLHHIQNSVFEGDIDESGLVKLAKELKCWLRENDSCIVFRSQNKKWLKKEFLIAQKDQTDNFI